LVGCFSEADEHKLWEKEVNNASGKNLAEKSCLELVGRKVTMFIVKLVHFTLPY
jgi:hypothetical protein